MSEIIKVKNISKNFGPLLAVNDVSFSLSKGDVLGFLGPNGAGKTTTMRILTGYLNPSKGFVEINGINIKDISKDLKNMIGYVPEGAPLYGEMTALGFLDFIANLRGYKGVEKENRINEAIKLLGLETVLFQQIETFSKGFKRRVALAQAIIHDPEVLILDEPTDGLDPNQKNDVRNLIKKLGVNKAIIISTHVLEEVNAICNRAMIISKGRLLIDDTPSRILTRSNTHGSISISIKGITSSVLKNYLSKLTDVKEVIIKEGNCLVIPKLINKTKDSIHKLVKKNAWQIEHFSIIKGSLEEIFSSLTLEE